MEEIKEIQQPVSAEWVEKKSKFIADVFPVYSEKETKEKLEQVRKRYYDAKHHCFAYRIATFQGIEERFSDDGEPNGTAGAPMMTILQKNGLANIMIVVTRYFGGILLGTGGLVRAYSEATQLALEKAQYISKIKGKEIEICVEYKDLEKLKYYCKQHQIRINNIEYSNFLKIKLEIGIEKEHDFPTNCNDFGINLLKYEIIQEKYIEK